MQETQVWPLGQGDALEESMATHSSILGWRIPKTDELGGLQSTESQRVRHDWYDLARTQIFGHKCSQKYYSQKPKGRKNSNVHQWKNYILHQVWCTRYICYSVTQSCPILCDQFTDCSMPGSPVLHYLLEFTQTCIHQVSDAIQPISSSVSPFSHLQSFPPSGSFPMSQLFVSVDKVLELQHQSFQWTFRVDFL